MAAPTSTPRRPSDTMPVVMIVVALGLLSLQQIAVGDWIAGVVMLCTIGFIIIRERTYRR